MSDVITLNTYELPKKLTLDWLTWRCGRNSAVRHGAGSTQLLNEEGFMCCLGQFSEQAGVPKETLADRSTPRGLFIGGSCVSALCTENGQTNQLAAHAMMINDDTETRPDFKLRQLTELFAAHGYEITVINKK